MLFRSGYLQMKDRFNTSITTVVSGGYDNHVKFWDPNSNSATPVKDHLVPGFDSLDVKKNLLVIAADLVRSRSSGYTIIQRKF